MTMTMSRPDAQQARLVCTCSGTTTAHLRRLVERGATRLEEISQATGACSGCGACDHDILEYLATTARPGQHSWSHSP